MSRGLRKRMSVQYDTDSSSEVSDDERTPIKQNHLEIEPRSSERIRSKSSKKFKLPDRKSVFNSIPSLVSPANSIEKLKPRKLVNNFTRVTHRYNYDKASSDEDENDDFIDDGPLYGQHNDASDDEDDGSHVEDESVESNQSYNLKQRHHVSILESDSESNNEIDENSRVRNNSILSDSDTNSDTKPSQSSENIKQEYPKSDKCVKNVDEENLRMDNCVDIKSEISHCDTQISDNYDVKCDTQISDNYDVKLKLKENSSFSDDELISPVSSSVKKLKTVPKKTRVLDSGSESDSNSVQCGRTKGRVLIQDSDSESSSSSSEPQRLYSSNEDDEKCPSERAQLMANRRQARSELFQQLKAKRRPSKEKS